MAPKLRESHRVAWTQKAEKQWDKILLFYCQRNGSNTYSNKLNDEIHRLLKTYCQDPELGQETKRRGVRRCIIAGRFAVFYRIKKDAIEVVAIVDARRNVPLD